MKVLFFGDIIGKIGRRAIKAVLPEMKAELKPDLVIANVENLAHGAGLTSKTLDEMIEAGVDFFTSGNHVMSKPEASELLNDRKLNLIRPANYTESFPGRGFKIIEVGSRPILVINMMGQVFIKDELENPFHKLDQILSEINRASYSAVIVDFHAEATSEKNAFGWYADGRVGSVLGTHTHVPTADAKILSQGTAYVSDVGMVGASDSVIGDNKELILEGFLADKNPKIDVPESGPVDVGAVMVELDLNSGKALSIERVDRKIEV